MVAVTAPMPATTQSRSSGVKKTSASITFPFNFRKFFFSKPFTTPYPYGMPIFVPPPQKIDTSHENRLFDHRIMQYKQIFFSWLQ